MVLIHVLFVPFEGAKDCMAASTVNGRRRARLDLPGAVVDEGNELSLTQWQFHDVPSLGYIVPDKVVAKCTQ
jgi:hypothetical protein